MSMRTLIEQWGHEPWAIRPDYLQAELARAEHDAEVDQSPTEEARVGDARRRQGVVAVIPIQGVIGPDDSFDTNTRAVSSVLSAAVAEPKIKAVVFDIDSPGGVVTGTPELADQIFAARSEKQILAVANPEAASGAFYLGSQADELFVTPSGEVGSLGVVVVHFDHSKMLEDVGINATIIKAGKFKWEGHPFGPLDEEAVEHLQGRVDGHFGEFVDTVARGRGTDGATVRQSFGQGRMVLAKDAIKVGMVDRIGGMAEALERVGAPAGDRSPILNMHYHLHLVEIRGERLTESTPAV